MISQHRQYRVKLSDKAWALVSGQAATQHIDRGQVIDQIILGYFAATPQMPKHAAELLAVSVDLLPKPPAEPADAGIPFTPAPKPKSKRRG